MQNLKKIICILFLLFYYYNLFSQSDNTAFYFKNTKETDFLYRNQSNYLEYVFSDNTKDNLVFEVSPKTMIADINYNSKKICITPPTNSKDDIIFLTIKYKGKTIKEQKFELLDGDINNYTTLFCLSKNGKVPLKNVQTIPQIDTLRFVTEVNDNFARICGRPRLEYLSCELEIGGKKYDLIMHQGLKLSLKSYNIRAGDTIKISKILGRTRIKNNCNLDLFRSKETYTFTIK